MINCRFDERSYAEQLHKSAELKKTNNTDLTIYAKYLMYNELSKIGKDYGALSEDELASINKRIKYALNDFATAHFTDFNKYHNYKNINNAIDSANKYKLRLPQPLPITKKEWETIQSIENPNYQKVLFVMLVDAKYYRYFTTSFCGSQEIDSDTVFYCQMDRAEIFRNAKAKFKNKAEKDECYHYLITAGLISVRAAKTKITSVNCVDISDKDIIDHITDYNNLDLHYMRLCGEKITQCKICGCLIKQNKYCNRLYCNEHKGYNKKDKKIITCIDCGKTFEVSPYVTNKVRCEECQRIHYLKKQREAMRKRRNSNVSE